MYVGFLTVFIVIVKTCYKFYIFSQLYVFFYDKNDGLFYKNTKNIRIQSFNPLTANDELSRH